MLIKIDRSTIRTNPNAGRDTIKVAGPTTITFKASGPDDRLKDGVNCFIHTWYDDGSIEGEMFDMDLYPALLTNPSVHFSIQVHRNIETVYTLPEPLYLYEYENLSAVCDECSLLVPVKDIESEWVDDGDGGEIDVTVCPKCGKMDTFPAFEYESLNEAVNAK